MTSQSERIKDYEAIGCLVINLQACGTITKEQKGILIEVILVAIEAARHPLLYNALMMDVSDRLDEIIRQTMV